MLVHWPSCLYKHCDLNCTTNVAKVQISVATPTGKEKNKLVHNLCLQLFHCIHWKTLSREWHSALLGSNVMCTSSIQIWLKNRIKNLFFSKIYQCSEMDVEIWMLLHAVTQVCSSHLLLPGISHKRKITVKWQMPSKLEYKVKEYFHLWPHSLHKFLHALM